MNTFIVAYALPSICPCYVMAVSGSCRAIYISHRFDYKTKSLIFKVPRSAEWKHRGESERMRKKLKIEREETRRSSCVHKFLRFCESNEHKTEIFTRILVWRSDFRVFRCMCVFSLCSLLLKCLVFFMASVSTSFIPHLAKEPTYTHTVWVLLLIKAFEKKETASEKLSFTQIMLFKMRWKAGTQHQTWAPHAY